MLWVSDQIVQAYLRGRGTFAIVSSCWMKLRFSIKVEEIPLWAGGISGRPVGSTRGESPRHANRSVLCCCSQLSSSSTLPTFLASGSQPRGHEGWGLPLQVLAAGGLRSALSQLPGASLFLPVARADPSSLALGGRSWGSLPITAFPTLPWRESAGFSLQLIPITLYLTDHMKMESFP